MDTVIVVWDGTREKGPYIKLDYDGTRPPPPAPPAPLRGAALRARITAILREQPRSQRQIMEALGPEGDSRQVGGGAVQHAADGPRGRGGARDALRTARGAHANGVRARR